MAAWMKQGDAYFLPVRVTLGSGALTIGDVTAAEFMVGDVRRMYPGEVRYDGDDGCFYVPLTQEETFKFPANGVVSVDVRVKFNGGNVAGARRIAYINVVDAVSEEVL